MAFFVGDFILVTQMFKGNQYVSNVGHSLFHAKGATLPGFAEVRARVRQVLDACMPGGGYVLGTGNSVANYLPVQNFLAMVDEGHRWRP